MSGLFALGPLAAAALLAVILSSAPLPIQACSMHAYVSAERVSVASMPKNVSAIAYTAEQIAEIIDGFDAFGKPGFAQNNASTLTCVDSRGEVAKSPFPILTGTPGGDFSEFNAALVIYHRHKNITVTQQSVTKIFLKFMNTLITVRRPFYFHNSDGRLKTAFDQYATIIGKRPATLPRVEPKNKTQAEAWYEVLSAADNQGCGHVKLIMTYPEKYGLAGEEGKMSTWLIKAFFKYWWPTKDGSLQRSRTLFTILPGDLKGRALSIVNNIGPACPGFTPTTSALHADSTQFVYAAQAVSDFRTQTLVPWFVKNMDADLDPTQFLNDLVALQNLQLGTTLTLLAPLPTLPLFSVDLETQDPKMQSKNAGRKLVGSH